MATGIIAHRYAKALFLQASGNKAEVEQFSHALERIAELFSIKDAASVLSSPVMPFDLKMSLLSYALGENKHVLFQNFLHILVQTDRISCILDIRDQFDRLRDDFLGQLRGTLISALPLEEPTVMNIQQILSTQLGKKILLKTEIQPEILGGFLIKIGHQILDLSLKSKIKALTGLISP